MTLLETFHLIGQNIWLYGGAFILVLSVLVFVHEWGHYIVARICGVRVEVFSIGFGKELFGFTDKSGTRWKFSLIPLGGYVKMFGDVDPASVKHSDEITDRDTGEIRHLNQQEKQAAFFNKPVWKRSAIVFAGPAINYIFAIILLAFLFSFNGRPVTPPEGAAVVIGSSAEAAGFQPHDRILSIDGDTVEGFEDVRRQMLLSLDRERHFVVERDGRTLDLYAQPQKIESKDRFGFRHSRGLLGLISPQNAVAVQSIAEIDGVAYETLDARRAALAERMGTSFTIGMEKPDGTLEQLLVRPLRSQNESLLSPADSRPVAEEEGSLPPQDILYLGAEDPRVFVQYGAMAAIGRAMAESVGITLDTLYALGQMITGHRSATELGGIIRIGALAGDMASQGLVALVLFTALLSINLGLINLFPIPLLDGGHLVFYAVEAVRGKPVPDRIQEYAFQFGLLFLVCLMAFANLNDLMQLIL